MKKFLTLLVLIAFSITFIGSSFAEDIMLSAEMRMKSLAIRSEQARMLDSGIWIFMGILIIGLGVAAAGSNTYADSNTPLVGALLFAGMGGVLIALGISERNSLSPTEVDYLEICSVESISETGKMKRESLAAEFLRKYADEGQRRRMGAMATDLIVGGAFAANPHDALTRSYGYGFLSLGIINFFVRTDVEYEYDDYLKSKMASNEGFVKTESATKEAPVQ